MDESEVAGDSWGDTQVLAEEAQAQVWVMGDQGPSAWLAWRDLHESSTKLIHPHIPPGMGWGPFSP